MTSLLSPKRSRIPTVLRATFIREDRATSPDSVDDPPPQGWLLAAAGGAWAAAAAAWVLTAGLAVVGWLAAEPGSLADALAVGTQLWLLANGGGAQLGALPVTLMPWGVTGIVLLVVFRFATLAARQAVAGPAAGAGAGPPKHPRTAAVSVAVVMVTAYLIPLTTVALLFSQPAQALRAVAVMAPAVGVAALWGAARAAEWHPTLSWPAWSRAVPVATAAAQLVLLGAGGTALAASLVVHRGRVADLHAALEPGLAGGLALLCLQLAFLPNVIVWTGAYALGAGFTLGGGSVVAPAATEVGLLPPLPILGALPNPGPGDPDQLAWLVAGGLAGVVAAWFVVRARPVARPDETALVGGLSGVAAALVFTGLAWASGGDLGVNRLADLGPRLLPLLVVGGTTMGLAGMATGLVLGVLRRLRARRVTPAG